MYRTSSMGARRRQLQSDLPAHFGSSRSAAQMDGAAKRSRVPAGHDHRHGAEQIRQALGVDIGDGHTTPVDGKDGHQRIAHTLVKPPRRGGGVILQPRLLHFVPAVSGHAVQQKPHRLSDAERTHTRIGIGQP
jgi:hypothetical protein